MLITLYCWLANLSLQPVPSETAPAPLQVLEARAAFTVTPVPKPVPAEGELLPDGRADPSRASLPPVPAGFTRPYLFEDAAQFPLPRFGLAGEPLCSDGVLIYEGMRFQPLKDGRYHVHFTVTIPDMPVTLRLQLAAHHGLDRCCRLTLPPIRFEPDTTGNPTKLNYTYQVHHEGYSEELRRWCGCVDRVERIGTARMGSNPPR